MVKFLRPAQLMLFVLAIAAVSVFADEVSITEKDGQYLITARAYNARIDERGSMQSLVVGDTDFLCPATEYTYRGKTIVWPGVACGMSQGGGHPLRLYALTRVSSCTTDSIKAEGEGWSLTYKFGPDTVDFRFQGFLVSDTPRYSFFCLNLASEAIQRVCEPHKHGEIAWPEVTGSFDGNLAFLDGEGRGFIARKGKLGKRTRKTYPHLLTFMFGGPRRTKPMDLTWHIDLFDKPDLSHAVRMFVTSPNPDHFFPGALEVTFPVRVEALYGYSCSGKLRFVGQPYVWKTPEVRIEADISLSPDMPEQTVNMKIGVPKPGHYTGVLQVTDGEAVISAKIIGFVASPEKIPPAQVPGDFGAFWDNTLAELAKIPLDMELKEFPKMETNRGRVYKVKYRSWGGRWAWAWLNVPKTENKVPGTVVCPAVGIYQPGTARPATGRLLIRAAVHGGDIENRPPKVDFDYMNTGVTDRETYMLRYSYCCLVRCYDILREHPLCNGTINVQGGSQGGGLSLVLAGLRQVKKVTAHSIALCRIDWTILGHTRWGPKLPAGEDPERIANIVIYYDPARFMHRIDPGCTVRLLFGLFDFCAPAEGVFTGINSLPPSVRCEVYADPFGGHHTTTGEAKRRFFGNEPPIIIPRWQGSPEDSKVVR